jgi:hypothetical protein
MGRLQQQERTVANKQIGKPFKISGPEPIDAPDFDFARIHRESEERIRKEAEDLKRLGKHNTEVKCVTAGCSSMITEERIERTLERNPMHLNYGGHNPAEIITKYYCDTCGVAYHHLPKRRREGGKKI